MIPNQNVDSITINSLGFRGVEFSAEKLRDRLGQLPDGEWREVQYIDHDGHEDRIYQIVCTLTKTGRKLSFGNRRIRPITNYEKRGKKRKNFIFDIIVRK